MTTTRPAPKFTAGNLVEVSAPDFETPGFPIVWKPGVVISIEWIEDHRVWDVMVRAADGTMHPQRVGVRGGNRKIRAR